MIREPSINPTAQRPPGKLGGKTPLAVFLVLALAIGAVGYAVFAHLEAELRQRKYDELGAVGDLKVSQIAGWLGERRGDAAATAGDPILAWEVQRWLESGAPHDEAARRIESRLRGLRQAYGYDQVILLDRETRPVLVAGDTQRRRAPTESDRRAIEAMSAGEPLLSDLHLEAETDGAPAKAIMDLYAPLLDGERRVVGAVYFRIDPYRFLFPFIQSWPTTSNSAETLLVRGDGDGVLYLNELRHRKDSALRFRLPLHTPDVPAAKSLRGETGVIEGVDYRGVPVLAALRTVPGTAWHLVAKIDRAEVFAPMRNLAIGVGVIVAVLIAGAGLLVTLWWRKQRAQVLVMHYEAEYERAALSKHLDLMSRHANDAIFLYDEAGRILEANERAVERYGYPRDELIGMSAKQLRTPGAAPEGRAGATRANETGSHIYETIHRRKDGSEFPVEASLRTVDLDGRRLTQGIVRDITVRKHAQEAILREKNFIGAALDSLPGLFYVIDDQGRFLRWNSNFESVSGYSAEEIARLAPTDFFAEPDKTLIAERIRQVFVTGEATAEADFIAKDRTRTPYFFTGRLVEIEHRPCLVGMGIDIAARKRAEARVERLSRLKAALSGVNHAIVHAESEQPLFEEICSILVERAGFDHAAIGIADPASGEIGWVAGAGTGAAALAAARRTVRADQPEGRGLTGTAVRECRHMISQDFLADPLAAPWHELGRTLGIGSTGAFPVLRAGRAVGVISVYSKALNSFDDEVVALLDEAAQDVSFALGNLDHESQRKQSDAALRESEERFRVLTELSADYYWRQDEQFRFVERTSSPAEKRPFPVESMLGKTRWELPALNMTESDWAAHRADLAAHKEFRNLEMARPHPDGRTRWISASGRPIFDYEGVFRGYRGVGVDITERKQAEERIRRLNRVYAVLSGINAAIVRATDRDELLGEACRIAVEAGNFPAAWVGMVDGKTNTVAPVAWQGLDDEYIRSIPVAQVVAADGVKPGKMGLAPLAILQRKPVIVADVASDPRIGRRTLALERGFHSVVVLPLLIADQPVGILALYAREIGFFDAEEMKLLGELAGDISFALDHIDKANKLQYLAFYDSLTGLANRALFIERLAQRASAATAGGSKFALCVFDVERFKGINDSLGRQAGDALLKLLAVRLIKAAGDPGYVARIGADQFAVTTPDLGDDIQITHALEQGRKGLEGRPYQIGGTEIRISNKAGFAIFPNDGADAETLFRNAEAALKKAKATGERELFYAREMTERIAEKLSLETMLRQAVEKEEFVLHYQPKVDLETRAITGVEALIRWQSPDLGLVPPGKFIPLMEETGLILEVGAWALRRAAADHRKWVEQRLQAPRVAVNVSAIQLRQRDFVAAVERAISEGIAPTGIDLEITESLIMDDVKGNIEKLKAMRARGASIAIDDFGTGYSSLGYLAKLPVQTLKIDRSFIISMLSDPDTLTLVSTIISLAHSLRLTVVAEGVEQEEQAKVLRLLRCDQMQGYLFSKPVPFDAMTALLRQATKT